VRVRCAVSMRALKRLQRLEAAHTGRVRVTKRAATLRAAATPGLHTVARASASLAGDILRSRCGHRTMRRTGQLASHVRRREEASAAGVHCYRRALCPRYLVSLGWRARPCVTATMRRARLVLLARSRPRLPSMIKRHLMTSRRAGKLLTLQRCHPW
jgi:hypothetical protein